MTNIYDWETNVIDIMELLSQSAPFTSDTINSQEGNWFEVKQEK